MTIHKSYPQGTMSLYGPDTPSSVSQAKDLHLGEYQWAADEESPKVDIVEK